MLVALRRGLAILLLALLLALCALSTPVVEEKQFIAAIVEGLGADAADFAECNAAGGALQCDVQNYTIAIFYSDKGVSGTLSRAIWSLSRLTRLDLSENQLHGIIPALTKTPDAAPKLTRLDLSNNALGGALPPSLAVLPLFDTGGLCVLSGAAHTFACPLPLFASTSCGLATACSSVPCATASDCEAFSPDPECLIGACSSTGACYWTAKTDFEPCVPVCNHVGFCRRGSCAPFGSIPSCPGTAIGGFQCAGRGECCARNLTSTYCACDDGFEGVDCYSTIMAPVESRDSLSETDRVETYVIIVVASAFILIECVWGVACLHRLRVQRKRATQALSREMAMKAPPEDANLTLPASVAATSSSSQSAPSYQHRRSPPRSPRHRSSMRRSRRGSVKIYTVLQAPSPYGHSPGRVGIASSAEQLPTGTYGRSPGMEGVYVTQPTRDTAHIYGTLQLSDGNGGGTASSSGYGFYHEESMVSSEAKAAAATVLSSGYGASPGRVGVYGDGETIDTAAARPALYEQLTLRTPDHANAPALGNPQQQSDVWVSN